MWYREYLGRPWVEYETGEAAFDCWGWVVFALKKQYGISDVPRCLDVKTGDHVAYARRAKKMIAGGHWRPVSEPENGDVVLMGDERHGLVQHIGMVDTGRVLHCRQNAGVCVERIVVIKKQFNKIQFWRHKSL